MLGTLHGTASESSSNLAASLSLMEIGLKMSLPELLPAFDKQTLLTKDSASAASFSNGVAPRFWASGNSARTRQMSTDSSRIAMWPCWTPCFADVVWCKVASAFPAFPALFTSSP